MQYWETTSFSLLSFLLSHFELSLTHSLMFLNFIWIEPHCSSLSLSLFIFKNSFKIISKQEKEYTTHNTLLIISHGCPQWKYGKNILLLIPLFPSRYLHTSFFFCNSMLIFVFYWMIVTIKECLRAHIYDVKYNSEA